MYPLIYFSTVHLDLFCLVSISQFFHAFLSFHFKFVFSSIAFALVTELFLPWCDLLSPFSILSFPSIYAFSITELSWFFQHSLFYQFSSSHPNSVFIFSFIPFLFEPWSDYLLCWLVYSALLIFSLPSVFHCFL